MRVKTRRCLVCGNRAIVEVPKDGFEEWQSGLVDIQHAMPGLDADQRELLLTGTHAHCWEQMWEGHNG